jgi:hypothetical protein
MDTAGLSKPRFTDGSLPNINFMHPVQGSDLIDAGSDVGIPFLNTKPDLGFWEFGTPPTEGTILSIGEIRNTEILRIFPSIVKEHLFIESNSKNISAKNISVFNINGQKINDYWINNINNSNIMELNVGHLPAGLYVCQMIVNGKPIQGKFIKQ